MLAGEDNGCVLGGALVHGFSYMFDHRPAMSKETVERDGSGTACRFGDESQMGLPRRLPTPEDRQPALGHRERRSDPDLQGPPPPRATITGHQHWPPEPALATGHRPPATGPGALAGEKRPYTILLHGGQIAPDDPMLFAAVAAARVNESVSHSNQQTNQTSANPSAGGPPSSSGRSRKAPRRRYGLVPALRRRPILWTAIGAIAVSTAVVAGVILTQTITTSPAAVAPDVVFALGEDYTAINAAGFATITIGTSGTSATATVNGVAGAADLQLVEVLNLTNQDGTQAYDITLKRSTTLNAAIVEFTVHVKTTAGATVVDWDAQSAASSSSFNLPASTTYEISIDFRITDGTSTGGLGSFDMQFEMMPA